MSCGLGELGRMGRAAPEEPLLATDVCLLFLGCVVMNCTLCSCNPSCRQGGQDA